jgi:hypothetical protein
MSTLDRAGFALAPFPRTFRAFAERGELGRVLVRMCVLAERELAMTFSLEMTSTHLRLRCTLGGRPLEVEFDGERLDDAATSSFCVLVRLLNEGLAGRDCRFLEYRPKGARVPPRVLFVDRKTSRWCAARSWEAAACLPEAERAGAEALAPNGASFEAPPSLVGLEQIVPAERILGQGLTYPALLAREVERIAASLGLEGVTCVPSPGEDPHGNTFQLTLDGTSLSQTLTVDRTSPSGLSDLLAGIGTLVALSASKTKGPRTTLHHALDADGEERTVLATPAETEALRRHVYLLDVGPTPEALDRLQLAGFALPLAYDWAFASAGGESSRFARMLTRVCALVREDVDLAFDLAVDEEGIVVRLRAGSSERVHRIRRGRDNEAAVDVACEILRVHNDLFRSIGVQRRLLLLDRGRTWAHGRIVFVRSAWLDIVRDGVDVRRDCLPEAESMSTMRPPRAYPVGVPADALPSVPEPETIVGKYRILESDFKCSARQEDLASMVRELAHFARIRITSAPLAIAVGDHYEVAVSHEGVPAVIRMGSEKYADPSPVLRYLNPILRKRSPHAQLHRFQAGIYSSGVLLADAADEAHLRRLAYLVAPSPEFPATDTKEQDPPLAPADARTAPPAIPVVDFADLDAVRRTLEERPDDTTPVFTLARAFDAKNEPHLATLENLEPVHQRRLAHAPLITYSVADAAARRLHRHDFAGALELYDLALQGKIHPMHAANPLYAVQNDNAKLGLMPDRAHRYLASCLPHGPQNPAIFVNASAVLLELGDAEGAIAMLASAIDAGFEGIEGHLADRFYDPLRDRSDFRGLSLAEPSYPIVLRRFQTLFVDAGAEGAATFAEGAREVGIDEVSGTLERPPDSVDVANGDAVHVFASAEDRDFFAFWKRDARRLEEQPIVVLGAEDTIPYAADFPGFLVLFACAHTAADARAAIQVGDEFELLPPDPQLLAVFANIDPTVNTRDPQTELARARALVATVRDELVRRPTP